MAGSIYLSALMIATIQEVQKTFNVDFWSTRMGWEQITPVKDFQLNWFTRKHIQLCNRPFGAKNRFKVGAEKRRKRLLTDDTMTFQSWQLPIVTSNWVH